MSCVFPFFQARIPSGVFPPAACPSPASQELRNRQVAVLHLHAAGMASSPAKRESLRRQAAQLVFPMSAGPVRRPA
jgi:hypothetical protein